MRTRSLFSMALMLALAPWVQLLSAGFADEPKDKEAAKAEPAKEEAKSEKPILIEDRLTDADPRDKVLSNSAHKVHVIKLKPGRTYQIDLMKKDNKQPLDPYLRIEDSTGKQLASDDDSGGGLNARIRFNPPKEDNYRIIATCLGGTGEYVLKVAPPLSLGKALLDVQGKLVQGAPTPVYKIKLSAGRAYVIDMESTEFDTLLVLKDGGGQQVARDDDSGEGTNARIRFTPRKDDTYEINALSFRGAGQFTLRVRAEGAARKAAKLELKDGEAKLDGKLDANDGRDNIFMKSPARTFDVQLKGGKSYTIDLKSADFDAILRLENSDGKQVAFDDDSGGGLDARITYRAPRDGVYRIIATCLDGQPGNFTLQVQEE